MNTIACHTLGCKVNQYDTEAMLELFDDDEKSEFYYLPDHADGKYLIL